MKYLLLPILTAFLAGPVLGQSSSPAAAAPPPAKSDTRKMDSAIPPKIPLRDFFKNPVSRGYDLSPDGETLSFLQPWESRMNIWIRPTAGGEAKRVTSEKDRDIRSYAWKGNKFLVYAMDDKGDENFHIKRVDLKSGDVKDLTPFPKVRSDIIDDLADVSEADMLITLNKRNPEVFDAFRLNVATGEMKMVAQNPGKVDRWITDHAGVIRAATETDGVNASLLTRPDEKTPFKKVLTTDFRESASPQFYTFDNKNLYAVSNIGRDKQAVVTIDPTNGKELEKIYENPEVDVSALAYSKARKMVTFAAFDTWKTERKFYDKQTEEMYKTLQEKLPGYEVEVVANDKAEDKFIVMASNDRSPGTRNLYNAKTGELTKLVEVAPWLPEKQLAPMKPIEYQSRDGLTIHGYLTLPLGREAKNLPVVINPHGGPWYRDTWGFNPEVQFLANRGYAVLQMNFRGSTGYGRKFWEASFKQWGQKMQDDITDGVQWLIKQGIADPKRVAIYGGSYGGYATLAGVTFTPDLYAAAVDYVGVANMFTFMKTIPPYWKPFLDMFHEMVGDPEKDKAMMEAASPVMHADKIKTPLFVAQGAHDPRVNKDESDQMVAALKKRGVDVEYMVKENEGHGFHNEENRFDFYGAMEKFLAKHLKPAA
ncbi:MAG TPA: S9 family peptidase [Chthoniobacterales bacterium]|jgi:dipeptidyl aminopeptidase/acylaminoacyl peptidase|nr:S9 family peptidase [Chthoniobacterales bacterium]